MVQARNQFNIRLIGRCMPVLIINDVASMRRPYMFTPTINGIASTVRFSFTSIHLHAPTTTCSWITSIDQNFVTLSVGGGL